jgi:hydrogenase nickel incorporation protein HypB
MARVIPILKEVTEANSVLAASLRAEFGQRDVLVLDIVASPGAGKTTLLERTIERLKDELRIAVIEGDPTSTIDADRVEAVGVPAVQINTGGGCHLDAGMIRAAFGYGTLTGHGLTLEDLDVIIIENVGNLLCPTGWDLGEDAKVVIASLAEGDDKPLKYPAAFLAAEAVVINKIDLAPYVPARVVTLRTNALAVNPELIIFEVSSLTGEGLNSWLDWIKARRAGKRAR